MRTGLATCAAKFSAAGENIRERLVIGCDLQCPLTTRGERAMKHHDWRGGLDYRLGAERRARITLMRTAPSALAASGILAVGIS